MLLVMACCAIAGCTREAKRDRHLSRAENYLKAGKLREAELESLNALRFDEKNLKALSILESIYYEQGRVLQVIPVLRALEEYDTNNVSARLKMARIALSFQQVEDARRRARFVLEKEKTNREAMVILAEAATSTEEVQEVQGLIEKWPKTEAASYHLIKATLLLKKQRDLAGAEAELQKMLEAEPKSLEAHQNLAWIAWLRGDFKRADELSKNAARFPGEKPFDRLPWAVLRMRMGELDEARKILESIAENHPEFLPAQIHLATIAFEQRRFEDCEKTVAKILAQDRSLFTPLELQARLKLARGATDEGVKELERLAEAFKQLPTIHYYLGLGYLQKRDIAGARKGLEKAIAMDPTFAEAIMMLADLDAATGNPGKAISALEPLVRQRPTLTRARMLLAEAYRRQGELEKAAEEYRQLAKAVPKSPQIKLLLGVTYRQQKKTNEARDVFERTLEEWPDYFQAAAQLVEMDVAANDLLRASNRVAQLVARFPNAADAHFLMAKVQLASRQLEQAEASLIKVTELQPESTAGYEALVDLYVATRRENQALAKLDELLARKPRDIPILMGKGLLQEKMQQPAKALATYQKLLEINPDFAPALNNAAYLAAETGGDLDRALQMAQRAVQVARDNAPFQDTLAWVFFKRGDAAAAAEILQASLMELRDNPEVQFHYGMACFALGRRDEAKEAFESAFKLSKDFPGNQQAQARLEVIALDKGKVDAQSISKLEAIQKREPKDAGVLLVLAEHYERFGDTNKAERAYAQMIAINSNSLPAMLKLARLAVTANSEEALKLIRAAYPLARNDAKMKHQLAKVALSAGDHAWALRVFQEVAESTREPEMEYDLALCQFWMGNSAAAEAAARQAVARGAFARANEAQRFLEVLKLYHATSPSSRDLGSSEAILKSMPDWPPALLVYAKAKERAGASNEARRVYEKITGQSPLLVPAAREYARFLTDVSGEPSQAQSLLEKTMKIAPLDATASAAYGEALYLTGSYTNAIKALRDSTRAGRADPESYYYLGLAYDKVGDKPQSKRTLNEALSLKPNHKLAADAREVLDRFDAESKLPGAKPF